MEQDELTITLKGKEAETYLYITQTIHVLAIKATVNSNKIKQLQKNLSNLVTISKNKGK